MIVLVRFADGSTQEAYGVQRIEIDDGKLLLAGRPIPLDRIASAALVGRSSAPAARPPVAVER